MCADIGELVRPVVRTLPPAGPFSPRPEHRGEVNLRFNENTFGGDCLRYPDTGLGPLITAYLAALDQLDPSPEGHPGVQGPENVCLTRGAVDALELLLRTFFEPGADAIATTPPVFGFFDRLTALHGLPRHHVPLLGPHHDRLDVARLLRLPVKGILLCDPGNPTGARLHGSDVAALLEGFPGLVVIDETYAEVAPGPSHRHRIAAHPRLLVLRSLSKGFGMAGLRLGAILADPAAVTALRGAQAPFPVPCEVVARALAELSRPAELGRRIALFVAQRDRLAAALARSPLVRHVAADAGFVTIHVTDTARVADALARARLAAVVEPDGLREHVRISIGRPNENRRTVAALAALEYPAS
ncbi:aminotransferase class I/II-fold pyridoxal phosphate-dependent enzyme [Streptomyces sp. YH02]|uniref:aminotransferase class I/II-fold pyridoxal phosphate-dependent enzyme n=1 Tax=Streptomyces sp. YH02 TaxID=3256999 RepID=UPI0037584707